MEKTTGSWWLTQPIWKKYHISTHELGGFPPINSGESEGFLKKRWKPRNLNISALIIGGKIPSSWDYHLDIPPNLWAPGKPGVDGWIQMTIYLEVYLNKQQIMENLHVGTLKITISIHASYASIQFHTLSSQYPCFMSNERVVFTCFLQLDVALHLQRYTPGLYGPPIEQ